MNYEAFVSAIKEEVESMVGTDMKVEVHTAIKNNGKERVGLGIKDENVNVMPAIYLEEYYDKYLQGESIKKIAISILGVYDKVRIRKYWDVKVYQDYNNLKSKLACKVINYEKNQKLLEEIPFIRFMDLAVVFYVLIAADDQWASTMLIKNEHIEAWKISKEELYHDAMENAEHILPAKFQTMTEVISEFLEEETRKLLDKGEERMYVLSNESRNLGAACIAYKHVLRMIGDLLGENFYIIPSSIHEVIIVPESKAPSEEELTEMIRDVNSTQIEEEEILSDHAYYYQCDKETLCD